MKLRLSRIISGSVLLALAMWLEHHAEIGMWQLLAVYMVPYLVVGADIIYEALEGIVRGRPFDEHLLMLVASLGVLAIGFFPGADSELHEAVLVLLLFQIGEYCECYAEQRSRQSISLLVGKRHYHAHVEETAQSGRSESERFIRRFARVYTPAVVGVAVVVAFVPPFFYSSYGAGLAVWLYRALTFLVVSCPCALVISVPLAFFGGMGKASRCGILMKGAYCVDLLAAKAARAKIVGDTAGSDEIETADVVIADDNTSRRQLAVDIARRTVGIARQNVVMSIGIKLLVLLLAAFGVTAMWMAVFADVGVTVLAVLNAMRAMR